MRLVLAQITSYKYMPTAVGFRVILVRIYISLRKNPLFVKVHLKLLQMN